MTKVESRCDLAAIIRRPAPTFLSREVIAIVSANPGSTHLILSNYLAASFIIHPLAPNTLWPRVSGWEKKISLYNTPKP